MSESRKHPLHPSFWSQTFSGGELYLPLEGDRQVDVAVVGAGITGLTTALELLKKGHKVCVLEKGRIGHGTTGSTSAHLSTYWDGGYPEILNSFGVASASMVARSMTEALNYIEENSRFAQDGADFKRVPGYVFAESKNSARNFEIQFQCTKDVGLPVKKVNEVPIGFATENAFRIENQGIFHPLKYLHGLASEITKQGGEIFENSAAVSLHPDLKTSSATIRYKHLVLATHTPLGRNVLQTALSACRSFVTVIRSQTPLEEALYWDSAQPYNYIRTYGEDLRTLIIGGKDHHTGHNESSASYRDLHDYTRSHFGVVEWLAQWSSQFYEPTDRLPMIGKSPFSENVWVATGFSGDGLTFGTYSGILLSQLISNEENRHSELYTPSRGRWAANKNFLQQNVQVTSHLIKDRLPDNSVDFSLLAPGTGAVSHGPLGGKAAYRAENGELIELSAVCSHMGCVVHWNDGEKSFDCPCHGSRFSTRGEVLEGPATKGLKVLKNGDSENL